LAALHREVSEETGLEIKQVSDYLGSFDYLSGSGNRSRQHTWRVTVTDSEHVTLTEHSAHAWVSTATEYPASEEIQTLIALAFGKMWA
jgi:8-oxo-dGTP diphosphatase